MAREHSAYYESEFIRCLRPHAKTGQRDQFIRIAHCIACSQEMGVKIATLPYDHQYGRHHCLPWSTITQASGRLQRTPEDVSPPGRGSGYHYHTSMVELRRKCLG